MTSSDKGPSQTVGENGRRLREEMRERQQALSLSWLTRCQKDASYRWRSLLGETDPEAWADPGGTFERDGLSIVVDGIHLTEHRDYRNGNHEFWLTIPGSKIEIKEPWHLADALDDRSAVQKVASKTRRWWRRSPGNAGSTTTEESP